MLTASRTVTAIPAWASSMLNNDSFTTEVFAIQLINSIICITQIIKLHKTIPTREQTKPGQHHWQPPPLTCQKSMRFMLSTGWGLQTKGQVSLCVEPLVLCQQATARVEGCVKSSRKQQQMLSRAAWFNESKLCTSWDSICDILNTMKTHPLAVLHVYLRCSLASTDALFY